MKQMKLVTIMGTIFCAGAYIVFSNAIQSTSMIWIMTRLFGLIAIGILFLTVLLGELRLLGIKKFFKFHTILGMATFYTVLLHFISAVFDKFKWGKSLSFIQYLGTTFSDQWMIALSVGAFAFYLIMLIGATSSFSGMRLIGYKKWKIVHFLSYLTLLFALGHSMVLGTDFNHSTLQTIVFPTAIFIFSVLVFLLALRIGKIKMNTRTKLIGLFFLVFMMSGATAYFSTRLHAYAGELATLQIQNIAIASNLTNMVNQNDMLEKFNTTTKTQIDTVKKQAMELSDKITAAKHIAELQAKTIREVQRIQPPVQAPEPIQEPAPPIINNTNSTYYVDHDNEYEND